ncbi:hypothetical protein [Listeria ilorinensis]|uniref:hypothetical protein n=1 Tax=Listeria ilorinensis TaxID=2867439 RepID=UPI001EF64E2F|nr:hypothetical protein [Listeria ilorinensis]
MTKKEIFVAAHKLAKTFEGNYGACFALALRTVYAELKNSEIEVVALKKWFVNKQANSYVLDVATFKVLKQTEKAYQLKVISKFGSFEMWAPKSVCMNYNEFMADEASKINYYEKALAFAKDNGVKGVRKNMKLKNIMKKIEEAGLSFSA